MGHGDGSDDCALRRFHSLIYEFSKVSSWESGAEDMARYRGRKDQRDESRVEVEKQHGDGVDLSK
jgi:hypothetical protein